MLDIAPRMKFWLSYNMKRIIVSWLIVFWVVSSVACSNPNAQSESIVETAAPVEKPVETVDNSESATVSTEGNDVNMTYTQITGAEAKQIMETEQGYIILDVRTQEEFDEGHIQGAILIPDYEIANTAESVLLDKEQLILVYCRSGRRSKLAAEELVKLGYSNVKEFGGVIDWEYGLVTD